MPFKAVQLKKYGNSENCYSIPYMPIGTILFAKSALSLASIFGGTWSRVDDGRTLIGVDESTYLKNNTGGSLYLQSHSHVVTSAAGKNHRHYYNHYHGSALYTENNEVGNIGITQSPAFMNRVLVTGSGTITGTQGAWTSGAASIPLNSYGSGNSQNVQPSYVVYRYKKTAN